MIQNIADTSECRATGIFTIPPSLHAWQDMISLANRYWYIPALPMLAGILAGIADWRWWIVALIILFIVLPTTALFAWIAVLGHEDAVRDIYPHALSVTNAGDITVEYQPMQPDAPDTIGSAPDKHTATEAHCPAPCSIPHGNIIGYTTTKNNIIIRYTEQCGPKTPVLHRLIIPFTAFRNTAEVIEFIRFLPDNQGL